ncbi:hypothetical protein K2173_001712 [Erythroxylum novogranatense]|uniref:Uncharacterized protein n=1 Tax=Erythroxylum novogranatense TaxID=1862640 RepID=A0AAV8S8A8_9ROSI|nr:hypothetical protein K2173_001712 [Erythroxylum novogranatense]
MASLSTQSPHLLSKEDSSENYRIYASFCPRDQLEMSTRLPTWIECYNPSNNTWNRVSTIPELSDSHRRKGFSMASIGESVYIIGGRLCRKTPGYEHQDHISEVDNDVLSSVLRYNIRTNTWFKCSSLGTPRYDFACSVSNNKIYVAGGKRTLDSTHGMSSAEVYDPVSDQWKALPDMNILRYKCVGVTWQGNIYIVGGFAQRRDCDKRVPCYTLERSSADMYDFKHDRWDLVKGMWQLDVPPNQIVAVDGKIFSSGDCLYAWKGHIEAYDAKLNIWNVVDGSHMQTIPSPISRSDATQASCPQIQRLYLTMAPIGTYMYLLSGYRMTSDISRSVSIVHIFDTSAKKGGWRSLEPLEEEGEKELCSHCCVVRQEP